EQAPVYGYEQLEHWLTFIVNGTIEKHDYVLSRWQAIEAEVGESTLRTKVIDKDEWYMTIGFREDTLPFKIALSLHEPEQGQSMWMLRTSIQDNADGQWYTIVYSNGQWHMTGAV